MPCSCQLVLAEQGVGRGGDAVHLASAACPRCVYAYNHALAGFLACRSGGAAASCTTCTCTTFPHCFSVIWAWHAAVAYIGRVPLVVLSRCPGVQVYSYPANRPQPAEPCSLIEREREHPLHNATIQFAPQHPPRDIAQNHRTAPCPTTPATCPCPAEACPGRRCPLWPIPGGSEAERSRKWGCRGAARTRLRAAPAAGRLRSGCGHTAATVSRPAGLPLLPP